MKVVHLLLVILLTLTLYGPSFAAERIVLAEMFTNWG
jgi:hypothetical protein